MADFASIDQISPTEFEYFVRDVFMRAGWTDLHVTEVNSGYRHGDGGVDIFARKGNRRFAIEVKQRAHGEKVGVDALNQLHTGAAGAGVKNRILVTNRYFTSEVKTRALRLGVDLVDRDDLKTMWETADADVGRRFTPRTYQQSVIDEIVTQYGEGKTRFLVEMATGLGKTVTAALAVKALEERMVDLGRPVRVLFLAHQLELLQQAAKSFRNVLRIGEYSYSACFDGVRPEGTDLVFATFDTMLSHLGDVPANHYDVVIVDEAHHAAARTYGTVVRNFAPRVILGLTATPYRTDAKDIFQFFGGDEGHIGRYDLCWALKNRKLAYPEYRVFTDDLTPEALEQLDRGWGLDDVDKRLFLRRKDEEIVSIIEDTIAERGVQAPRVIVFCRSIAHQQNLIQAFPAGSAVLIHSKMQDGMRRNNIEAFREGRFRFALVCDLFNEGVDIPEANVLVFLRYTASRTVWLQQLGRGLRKTSTKEVVQVLDFVGSTQRLREIETFRKEVEAAPREATANDPPGVHHDDSIEVKYSATAARVLALVERLELKLASRGDALEALRSWRDGMARPTAPEEFFDEDQAVSPDQVRTLFGSWWAFIIAAFGLDGVDPATIRERAKEAAKEHLQRSGGVAPSLAAISLATELRHLPLATERELRQLFGEDKSDDGILAPQEGATAPVSAVASPGLASEGLPIAGEDTRLKLVNECIDKVFRVEDFPALGGDLQRRLEEYNPSRFWWMNELQREKELRAPLKEEG